MRRILLPALVIGLAGLAGCSGTIIGISTGESFGGVGVLLLVREAGADLEFDCATGRIEEPMTFSAAGTFDVDGTFTPGTGGPVREDDPPIPEAARYMGVLRGDRLTLSAILVEDGTTIGPYELRRGEEPLLRRCL
ncbi:MAG: hypothetical protein V3U63_05680 [Gemmatimonadota bacterium]